MYSLFQVNFNWTAYFALAILLRVLFPGISWYSFIALLIALQQFMLLFYSIGSVIPIRYLFGTFMCLQMLVGPTFAFNGLDDYQVRQYKMQVTEDVYYSYVIPAVICFILGLHVTAKKLEGEIINMPALSRFADKNPFIAYSFIAIGFIASVATSFIRSDLGFALLLISNFKFIGAFFIILRKKQLQPLPLTLVFGSIISSSLAGAMFHDLLTWLIFVGCVFAIKYKPSNKLKLLVTFSFMVLAFSIQRIKGSYRQETWQKGREAGVNTLEKVYLKESEGGGFFSYTSLAESNLRINQGFIVTHILENIPEKVPYANGEAMKRVLEAAFLPRIIAPNKLNAGDREFFMKYSGMPLAQGTSMALSSVGDAYANFGRVGGCIFMFIYGLFFSTVLKVLFKASHTYPILLLFTGLMFYYPIRPDCELQTILGHCIKSCFLIFGVIQVWKQYFKADEPPPVPPSLMPIRVSSR